MITGAGDKAFVSGADVSRFESERASRDAVAEYNATSERAYAALHAFPRPTIAKIRGACVGGGVNLAVCCDLRLCGEASRFAVPAAKLGLGYGLNAIERLAGVIGPARAMEMLYTGRAFSAEEAAQFGLVHRVVPEDRLDGAVDEYAAMIVENAPLTIAAVKAVIGELRKEPGARDLVKLQRMVDACFESQDYIEGRRAFMEKRKPPVHRRMSLDPNAPEDRAQNSSDGVLGLPLAASAASGVEDGPPGSYSIRRTGRAQADDIVAIAKAGRGGEVRFLDLWSRTEADARFARLAEPNIFTSSQTIQHAEGDATSFLLKRGTIDLALLAAASEGRLGTLSNHDLLLLRQNQAKVTIQSNRVEFADHVETSGRFRVLGTVRTELRSGPSNGILETGTDHNLIIRRNAVAQIELRGDNTTDFKQPITRQSNPVWDDGNAPRSFTPNGYQKLPNGWLIQWGFASPWGSGDATITFPIAFPSACRVVQATHRGPDSQFWSARDLTATSFKINSSSGANNGYWWLAIGH